MPDNLHDRFAAFATDSVARTRPPGVTGITRTLRRRHATRATVLAVVALVLALAVPLSQRGGNPVPTVSHSADPSIAPSPTTTPPTTAPSTRPTRTRTGSSAPAGAALSPPCDPHAGSYEGDKLAGGPDTFTITPDMLSTCPGLRIRLVRAVYVGKSPTSARLTLS